MLRIATTWDWNIDSLVSGTPYFLETELRASSAIQHVSANIPATAETDIPPAHICSPKTMRRITPGGFLDDPIW